MDQFEETINQLDNKVSKITGTVNIPNGNSEKSSIFSSLSRNRKNLIYIGIPILVFVCLWVLKPKIILEEHTNEDGSIDQKVSIKRLLLSTAFFLIVGGIIYYVLKVKKNNS